MNVVRPLALGCLTALAGPPAAQEARPIDDEARGRLVEDIAEVVVDRYVFPDIAEQIADRILGKLVDGGYDRFVNGFDLAEELTRDLQSVNGDGHFAVNVVAPDAFDPPTDEELAAEEARRLEQLRKSNFGFERVELLPGNVGYLDLRQFADAELGGATAHAAMAFLAATDAVIVDVRQNGGGAPSMVQLLCSYFLDEPTHLNSFFQRGQDELDELWTLDELPGPRRPDTPLFVLTSRRTGSAAEGFSYHLKHLKRATIVGEVTAGGAHPGGSHPVGYGFSVFVSDGRAINPVTGTNWEGVGVRPDRMCNAAEALDRAHLEALRAIEAGLGDGDDRHALEWARATIEAKAKPVALPVEALASFAGQFGARRVELHGNDLYYARDGGPPAKLVPLTGELFAVEGADSFRVQFPGGDPDRLVGLYRDGRRDESRRDAGN